MAAATRDRIVRSAIIGILIARSAALAAQETPRSAANLAALERVEIRSHELAQAPGVRLEYGVYVPTTYDGSRATPLVLALHGLGSGVMYMMEYSNLVELAERYGYIVATPMGYNERGWYGGRGPGNEFNSRQADPGPANLGELSELDVMDVLRIVRRDFEIDDRRIYLIGQSMGGGGTWYLGTKYPELWAALAAMAPAVYRPTDELVGGRDLPVIVVQGDADESVDVNVTRRWVARMEELGMEHEYIEVPGGTHFSAGRDNIDKVFEFLSRHERETPAPAL
jgi:predicted peptidase